MHSRRKILVIDDDETCCRVLAEVLGREGYEVDWVTDGFEGFARCLGNRFDLVITDERMPLVHGSEIAEELRGDQPAVPILLISAFADARLAADASQLGVTLLAKPFATDQLLVAVRAALERDPESAATSAAPVPAVRPATKALRPR
jgi:DNA-binding response OmpR family regulator